MKRIFFLLSLFVVVGANAQSDIPQISNGESGLSTRTTINANTDTTNWLKDTINKYKDDLVNISLNTTHRGSDGSDHSDVVTNTAKVTNATHSGEVTGATALTIASNVIEADNMESTNSPTDNYVWSYDLSSGGGTWVENSGGSGLPSGVQGDIIYHNGSNWVVLNAGASGRFLQTNGAAANPSWESASGSGDVSFTDTTGVNKSIASNYDIDTIQGNIDDLQDQLNDTAIFYLQAIFGLGSGQTIDTASFAADAYCGSFRNWTGDTITIDSINAVMLGTTPDVDIQFFISTSISDGSAGELRTTDFNITSTTTGNTFTSFNGTIDVLPGQRIWCKVTAVATKPNYLEITVSYTPK